MAMKKNTKNPAGAVQASTEAAERRRLIAEAAERRRAERLAEEAEAGKRRAPGVELGDRRGPRRAKGLYDEDDEILPASAGSSIDDFLE